MTSREKVRAFGKSLRWAVVDCRAERARGGARFYFDADVILPMIQGVEGALPWNPSNQHVDLVRALASTQRFGRLHVLRPHGFELLHKLNTQNETVSPQTFKKLVDELFSHAGVPRAAEELQALVEEEAGAEVAQRVERIASKFRTYSTQTFIAIERAAGHWTHRLKRLYKFVIHFDNMGPEIASLWREDSEQLKYILRSLQKHRPRGGSRNMMDAAALTGLSRMIADSDEQAGPLIRFYTETRPLNDAWARDATLREGLSHAAEGALAEKGTGRSRGVFRSPDYFLMRMRFPALSTDQMKLPVDAQSSLEGLEDLVVYLDQIDGLDDKPFAEALRSREIENESLEETIESFNALSLMRGIWGGKHDNLIDNLNRFDADLRKVFGFINETLDAESFGEKINDIRSNLSGQLSEIATWSRDFKALYDGAMTTRKRVQSRGLQPIGDALRDLGLVRWGLDMTEEELDWVKDSVNELVEGQNEDELELLCFQLANLVDAARTDIRASVRVATLFWALERYGEAVRVVENASAKFNIPRGLRLLQAAARLRSSRGLQVAEQDRLIERLQQESTKLAGAALATYNLGLGYVIYFMWKEASRRRKQSQERNERLVKMCLELGEEAIGILAEEPDEKLAYAYALNHKAYSFITMYPDKVVDFSQCIRPLINLKNNVPEIWHARFDDTIGVYYVDIARKRLAVSKPTRADLRVVADALKNAQEFFKEAKANDTGGIDLPAHIAELEDVKQKFGAAREASD